MKKTLVFLLVASMLLAVLASCASEPAEAPVSEAPAESQPVEEAPASEAPAPSEEVPAEAPPEEAPAPEPASTIFTGDAIIAPPNDMELPIVDEQVSYELFFSFPPPLADKIDSLINGPALDELTARTNVKIEFYAISAAVASERYSIMLASGDFPAILQDLEANYAPGLDQAIEDEIIYDHRQLIEDYMPIYADVLAASEDIRLALTTTDGNIAGITRLFKEPSKSKLGNIIRQDWLDELGLSMPGTIDQLTEVLTAFKDEKGADEAYYLKATGTSTNTGLIGAFGVVADYYQEDGTVKLGAIEPGFKDYLVTLNNWYTDGIISPDYFGNTKEYPDNGKVVDGSIGVFLQEDAYLQDVGKYITDPESTLELQPVPAMILAEGDVNHFGSGFGDWTGGTTWSISTNCEDPEPLCRMINYLFTEEGSLLANYGVQGVSWEYDEGGVAHVTDTITNNPEINNSEAQLKYTLPFAPFVEDYSRFDTGYTETQLAAPGVWETNCDKANTLPTGLSMSTQYAEEYNSIYTDMETFISESINKFITGARPISEFDDYVAEVESMGSARCVELWQLMLDEYINK